MSGGEGNSSDEDLMILIARGDVRAFDQFYDRHSSVAFALAMRILNDRGLAADASQEAFLGFWRHRASYKPALGAGRPWLLGMVRHRAIDAWRRERNRRTDPSGAQLSGQPAPDDTESETIAAEEQRSIRTKLAQLPAEQRRVIELAYFGGLTHTEIARQLGMPLGTAKGRMRLALQKLRATMDDDATSERQPPT